MRLKSAVKSMIAAGLPELKAVAGQEAMAFTRDAGATRDTGSNEVRCVKRNPWPAGGSSGCWSLRQDGFPMASYQANPPLVPHMMTFTIINYTIRLFSPAGSPDPAGRMARVARTRGLARQRFAGKSSRYSMQLIAIPLPSSNPLEWDAATTPQVCRYKKPAPCQAAKAVSMRLDRPLWVGFFCANPLSLVMTHFAAGTKICGATTSLAACCTNTTQQTRIYFLNPYDQTTPGRKPGDPV